MRIGIGGFSHETSSFSAWPTTLDDFKKRQWLADEQVIADQRGTRSDLGGMIDAADQLGIGLFPTFSTAAEPAGTITREAYDTIAYELLSRFAAAPPLDAICLQLHGAGYMDGSDDLEGTFLGQLREVVGPDIPILVTLDLHGNTSDAMMEHATINLYCHHVPHVDRYDRGFESIVLAEKIVNGELKPTTYFYRLPAIVPPGQSSFEGPGKIVHDRCLEWENHPRVIDCTFNHGFPAADNPIMATGIMVATDNDAELAARIAHDVGDLVLEMIEDFIAVLPEPKEAVTQALAATAWPVVIAETFDNPGGGSPGDGTHLLRELLDANQPRTAFGFIWDPSVAAQAHAAGPGATIQIELGGFTVEHLGAPIKTEAYVKLLSDGVWTWTSPQAGGRVAQMGKSARLIIGNVDVIVVSERTQTFDASPFLAHGIDVSEYRIVALKSNRHFQGGFNDIAGLIIRADRPGGGSQDITRKPFTRIAHPLWPFDPLPFKSSPRSGRRPKAGTRRASR